MKIKDIPLSERPRERLKTNGVNNLSNGELISILIKDGTRNISSKDVANNIINKVDKIQDLRYITYEDLVNIKGVGISKASTVLAAIELGNRINSKLLSINNISFTSTDIVYEYYKSKIGFNANQYPSP